MKFSESNLDRAQKCTLNVYDFSSNTSAALCSFDQVVEAPMWSRDGSGIYINSQGLIWRYDLASGSVSTLDLGRARYNNNDHVLLPDGSGICVSGNVEDNIESKIYVVDFATAEVREVVSAPWSYLHGVSPDGTTLAYCAGRPIDGALKWDVYTCPIEGGPETRLTDAFGLNDGPEFSSDGTTIWFNSVRTGLMQIWRMDADGSNQTQMTFDDDMNSWFPHISPDLTCVVYLAYHKDDLEPGEHLPDKNVEIRMIDAKGGSPKVLLKLFGGQGSINVNSWSPDSQKFAYVNYDPSE